MTTSSKAFERLERAAQKCRRDIAALDAADHSNALWSRGVFIGDSEEILDAAESLFGQFGNIDDGPAADIATANLIPADLSVAIQCLSHATKESRSHLKACSAGAGAVSHSADVAFINTVKRLVDVTETTIQLARKEAAKAARKPVPAPAPKPAPIDNTKLVDAVFKTVTEYVAGEMSKHSDQEREAVQRLINDKIGDLKDSLRTREDMRELKDMQTADALDRRFAGLGKTVNAALNRRIEESQGQMVKDADRLAKMQARQVRKELVDRLEQIENSGDPGAGEMPRHEWDGTRVRFEIAPGVWGEWTDVEGPRGQPGQNAGGGSPKNLMLDGGGAFDANTGLDGEFASNDYTGIPGLGGGGANTVYSATTFNAGRAI